MEQHDDFFKWYKTKIVENAPEPPDHVWDNISDELDIKDVWQRVAGKLDHRGGWSSARLAIPALLLLLLSGGIFYYTAQKPDADALHASAPASHTVVDSLKTTPSSRAVAGSPDLAPSLADAGNTRTSRADANASEIAPSGDDDASEITPSGDADASEITPSGDADVSEVTPTTAAVTHTNEPLSLAEGTRERALATSRGSDAFDTNRSHTDVAAHEDAPSLPDAGAYATNRYSEVQLPALVMPDSMLSIHPIAITLEANTRAPFRASDTPLPRHEKSIAFGISASVKNTWLLNRITFAGLEKHTLNTTLPDFGKDLGVVFTYNFAPLFAAQAEGFFVSEVGQRYEEYRKGKYVSRDVDLDYYHFNLTMKYGRNSARDGRPMNAHALVGGVYYSMLKSATETIGAIASPVRDTYAGDDYGVVLGYEYNRHLLRNLTFTTGLRLNYGLRDIRPASDTKTATGSVDVNFALKYRIALPGK